MGYFMGGGGGSPNGHPHQRKINSYLANNLASFFTSPTVQLQPTCEQVYTLPSNLYTQLPDLHIYLAMLNLTYIHTYFLSTKSYRYPYTYLPFLSTCKVYNYPLESTCDKHSTLLALPTSIITIFSCQSFTKIWLLIHKSDEFTIKSFFNEIVTYICLCCL